jgi:hypothetical protein
MVYAMLYADTADIVGTYESREAALADLATMVAERPDLRDDLGLRALENRSPVGDFESASDLLGDQLPQQQLDVGSAHGE